MLKKILLILLAVFALGSAATTYLAIAYPATGPAAAPRPGATEPPNAGDSYTATQVAAHTRPDDCWLIVRGSVYDVTSYIPAHPGGRRNITDVCGKEVTSIFSAIHSNRAWDLLGRYKIGTLTTAAAANGPSSPPTNGSGAEAEGIVADAVRAAFPGSTVLTVRPFGDGYTALISTGNMLVDVVTDSKGAVLSQSTRRDELEWFWTSDDDEVREWHDSGND